MDVDSPQPPQPTSSDSSDPTVHTYHCVCTHLILASTTALTTLPKRGLGARDKASILPLPPLPHTSNADSDSETEDPQQSSSKDSKPTPSNYALLLGTTIDRTAQIIAREDGFEKRWLQRCGRCRLVVGYQLDWGQYSALEGKEGRRDDVVYLLDEGLVSTGEMKDGKTSA